jgi:hypothetical protein|tara:strand:+ start:118 stop:576 length:459 start_codon:yes stop_codon:yes gene_type:complete
VILRRSSQGHRIRLHRNTSPGATRTKKYKDGTTETLAYPSSYKYFIDVDGEVVKKSNSFKTIEEHYVNECAKKYDNGHGRLVIGKHHLINNVATSQSDYPTSSNTKSEIKSFFDMRNIEYDSKETKEELLFRIQDNYDESGSHVSKTIRRIK